MIAHDIVRNMFLQSVSGKEDEVAGFMVNSRITGNRRSSNTLPTMYGLMSSTAVKPDFPEGKQKRSQWLLF